MADPQAAPISPQLRATLAFVRKMTLEPDALSAADARAVLDAGVSREVLTDAIDVAWLFAFFNRLAEGLGWDVPPDDSSAWAASAKRLRDRGYV